MSDRPKKVIVFSTPTCSYCNKLKSYLRENKVSFRDIDISRDAEAARDVYNRSGQKGVPVTLIDNQLVIGFDKAKIDRILGINKGNSNNLSRED